MTEMLLTLLLVLVAWTIVAVSAALAVVTWLVHRTLAPVDARGPTVAQINPDTVEEMVNGALGWDDTDPTDHIFPRPPVPLALEPNTPSDLIPTPDGNYLDATGTIDQLGDGQDEPSIMADGTIVLNGEIIREAPRG